MARERWQKVERITTAVVCSFCWMVVRRGGTVWMRLDGSMDCECRECHDETVRSTDAREDAAASARADVARKAIVELFE